MPVNNMGLRITNVLVIANLHDSSQVGTFLHGIRKNLHLQEPDPSDYPKGEDDMTVHNSPFSFPSFVTQEHQSSCCFVAQCA
ncbi:unnamed protein product [Amoebophrya sp. A120]|nr:unnamed protein product [Amoebophrya sp. A120]|eukprot:GSA120T00009977001.1